MRRHYYLFRYWTKNHSYSFSRDGLDLTTSFQMCSTTLNIWTNSWCYTFTAVLMDSSFRKMSEEPVAIGLAISVWFSYCPLNAWPVSSVFPFSKFSFFRTYATWIFSKFICPWNQIHFNAIVALVIMLLKHMKPKQKLLDLCTLISKESLDFTLAGQKSAFQEISSSETIP